MERSHGGAEPPKVLNFEQCILPCERNLFSVFSQDRTWRKEGVTMTNHYETPEVVEVGRAKNVIMGMKIGVDRDPETGEFTFDEMCDDE